MRAGKKINLSGREEVASLMYSFGVGSLLHWPIPVGHIAGAHRTGEDRARIWINVAAHRK